VNHNEIRVGAGAMHTHTTEEHLILDDDETMFVGSLPVDGQLLADTIRVLADDGAELFV